MKAGNRAARAVPVLAAPSVRIMGRVSLTVEAHKGISEFTPESVTVRLSGGSLRISGRGLSVDSMSESFLTVSGTIDAVSFAD